MSYFIDGQLEVDFERGVIYFHAADSGHSRLRIQGLPSPIPDVQNDGMLDLNFKSQHANWLGVSAAYGTTDEEVRRNEAVDRAVNEADRIILDASEGTVAETDYLTSRVAIAFAQKVHSSIQSKLSSQDLLKRSIS